MRVSLPLRDQLLSWFHTWRCVFYYRHLCESAELAESLREHQQESSSSGAGVVTLGFTAGGQILSCTVRDVGMHWMFEFGHGCCPAAALKHILLVFGNALC